MTTAVVPAAAPPPAPVRPQPSLLIKGLLPRLPDRGRIKIGRKGELRKSRDGNREWQMPVKLDHFVITTNQRGRDNNFLPDVAVHRVIGDKPTRIPVQLLFDDLELNFQSRYACFKGRTLWCSGDGEQAWRLKAQPRQSGQPQAGLIEREELPCLCGRERPDYPDEKERCKMNGSLGVLIRGVPGVGGVYRLRTTSFNSIVGLTSSLMQIKAMTGGFLAGIPLELTLDPKTMTSPTDGQVQTVYVVGIEYAGTPEQLMESGYQIALRRESHKVRIEQVEQQARQLLLSAPAGGVMPEDQDELAEIVEEFYPEQAMAAAGAAPPRPQRRTGPSGPPAAPAPAPAKSQIIEVEMVAYGTGQVLSYSLPEEAELYAGDFEDQLREAHAAGGLDALDQWWESNSHGLPALRALGRADLADGCQALNGELQRQDTGRQTDTEPQSGAPDDWRDTLDSLKEWSDRFIPMVRGNIEELRAARPELAGEWDRFACERVRSLSSAGGAAKHAPARTDQGDLLPPQG